MLTITAAAVWSLREGESHFITPRPSPGTSLTPGETITDAEERRERRKEGEVWTEHRAATILTEPDGKVWLLSLPEPGERPVQ